MVDKKKGIALGGLALGSILLFALTKKAKAEQYICPICGAKFTTYNELNQHFTTEHPAEPIDIIWE